MIDSIILAPYYWALKLRHFLYDSGIRKVRRSPVPTICIGNITVGGTGKTPHTEMLLRLLQSRPEWEGKNVAVLSRGYGRKSKGFRLIEADDPASMTGDEPLQIKRKFPDTTVAVDRDRVEGCRILAGDIQNPAGSCCDRRADLIILDDAFQYRSLDADFKIVLMDYGKPVYKDHLLPMGHLRDLPERICKADAVIVTKCPPYLDEWRKDTIRRNIGFKGDVLFTTVSYRTPQPVFPEGDPRYVHSGWLILVTGIANATPLVRHLSDSYKIVKHISFGDHHRFSAGDIRAIEKAAEKYPAAIIATTEKDSQRIRDCKEIPSSLKERMFSIPICAGFISEEDEEKFISSLNSHITRG